MDVLAVGLAKGYAQGRMTNGATWTNKPVTDGVILLAHGTVENVSQLPEFLKIIRRGRDAEPALLAEMERRYEAIGGSPLLRITREQGAALQAASGMPCAVAMRLWEPRVESVIAGLVEAGVRRICLLPLAPFSVSVYCKAARLALAQHPLAGQLRLVDAPAWGEFEPFINAQCEFIEPYLTESCELLLTAHSLPLVAIERGDRYAVEAEACATAVARRLPVPAQVAYQSQGAGGGKWLGPTLEEKLRDAARRGVRRVVLYPFGFLADHVETLYDLDVEAQQEAQRLGLELVRVPALNAEGGFIAALHALVQQSFADDSECQ